MPSPAAAILEFGALLHAEATSKMGQRDPRRIETAEQRLIEGLTADRNTLLKPALLFHATKPVGPFQLRVLSLVAFLQLATNFGTAIGDVAVAVAGEDEPSKVLELQQCIPRLLYCKRLVLRVNSDDQLELDQQMLTLLPTAAAVNTLPSYLTTGTESGPQIGPQKLFPRSHDLSLPVTGRTEDITNKPSVNTGECHSLAQDDTASLSEKIGAPGRT